MNVGDSYLNILRNPRRSGLIGFLLVVGDLINKKATTSLSIQESIIGIDLSQNNNKILNFLENVNKFYEFAKKKEYYKISKYQFLFSLFVFHNNLYK